MAAGMADFLKERHQLQKRGFGGRAGHVALQGSQKGWAVRIKRPRQITKRLPPFGKTETQPPVRRARNLRREKGPDVGGMIHATG